MKNDLKLTVNVCMTLALLLAAALMPSYVAAESSPWRVKGGLILLRSDAPFSVSDSEGGRKESGGNASIGSSLALEYRLNQYVSLEVSTAYTKSTKDKGATLAGKPSMGEGASFQPSVLGLNFYLLNNKNYQLYMGPRAAYVQFGNFDLRVDSESKSFQVKSQDAWGGAIGFNYRYGNSRWWFNGELSYLDVDMEVSQIGESHVVTNSFDPMMLNLGVAFDF